MAGWQRPQQPGQPQQYSSGLPQQQPQFSQQQQYGSQMPQQYGSQMPMGGQPYQSGYASQQQMALPPGVSPQEFAQIQQWFAAVDTDRSGQISVQELHRCLSMGGNSFSIDVVQRLIIAFDTDRSGQIGLHEFVAMHKYLQAMKESFQFFDKDKSGTLDPNELHQALTRAGYNVSQQAVYSAFPRFDKQRKSALSFDQYLDFCIYLGNVRKLFSFYDPQNRGIISVSFDQLIASTPYFT